MSAEAALPLLSQVVDSEVVQELDQMNILAPVSLFGNEFCSGRAANQKSSVTPALA